MTVLFDIIVIASSCLGGQPTQTGQPPVTALAHSGAPKCLLAGSQAGLDIRDAETLEIKRNLETEVSHVLSIRFSSDSSLLAVAGGAPAEVGVIEVYRWPGPELLWRSEPHRDMAHSVSFSPTRKHILSAGMDHSCILSDAVSGNRIASYQGHSRGVLAVRFLSQGQLWVSGGLDQSVRLWETGKSEPLRSLQNHTQPVTGLAIRPGEASLPMVASISRDKTVRLWQPTIGRLVRFARLPAVPLAVEWLDERYLVVSCDDGHVRKIDHETVEVTSEVEVFDGWAYSLAVTRDRQIYVGGPNQVVRKLSFTPTD